MVGGMVIEAKQMRITAGAYPGVEQDVIRLWCEHRGDECAVYADHYWPGDGPKVGDSIWWQAGKIYFDGDRRSVRKVGYSFDPRKAE